MQHILCFRIGITTHYYGVFCSLIQYGSHISNITHNVELCAELNLLKIIPEVSTFVNLFLLCIRFSMAVMHLLSSLIIPAILLGTFYVCYKGVCKMLIYGPIIKIQSSRKNL